MTEQGKAPAARTATHTPGPWRAKQAFMWGPGSTNERVNWIPDPHRFAVYGPRSDEPAIADDVWEPDAKLIAAAPALADELERLVWEGGLGGYCRRCHAPEPRHKPMCSLAAALRAAGRLDEPQVSAAEPPLKAVEIPAIPDSKG